MPRRMAGPSRNSCHRPFISRAGAGLAPPRERRQAASRAGVPVFRAGTAATGSSGAGSRPWRRRVARACLTPAGGGASPAPSIRRAAGVCRERSCTAAHARKPEGSRSHTTAPPSIAITRSAAPRQRSRRCSISSTAVSDSWFSRRSCQISSSPATGSSCEVGSSSSTSGGRETSVAASATRCSSPPESSAVGRSSRPPMPSASATSSTARATAPAPRPRFSTASASSARTVDITTCVSGSCSNVPATAPIAAGGCSRVSRPATVTRPAKVPPWKCGTSPAAARSSVDLPEPERPASTQNSPGARVRVTSRSAGAPPPG